MVIKAPYFASKSILGKVLLNFYHSNDEVNIYTPNKISFNSSYSMKVPYIIVYRIEARKGIHFDTFTHKENEQVLMSRRVSCADIEVGHSNTEESVLYFIRKKCNIF